MNSTLSFTNNELRDFGACDREGRIEDISAHLGYTPQDHIRVPLAAWVEVTPDVMDLVWALRCCWWRGGRAVGVEMACRAAERTLAHATPEAISTFRAAIDATRGYMAGTVDWEECNTAANAALDRMSDNSYSAARASYYAALAALNRDDELAGRYAHVSAWAAQGADVGDDEAKAQRADLLALISH